MLKKFFINARYFIAPLLILATLFGVLAGGPWVWTGVFLLGVGIIIDTLLAYNETTTNPISEPYTKTLLFFTLILLEGFGLNEILLK